MSDKLLLLTYFIFGVVVIYAAVKGNEKVPTFKASIWAFVPVWVMLIIQMWLNVWHGIG